MTGMQGQFRWGALWLAVVATACAAPSIDAPAVRDGDLLDDAIRKSDAGDSAGQRALGIAFARGRGVPVDMELARRYLRAAGATQELRWLDLSADLFDPGGHTWSGLPLERVFTAALYRRAMDGDEKARAVVRIGTIHVSPSAYWFHRTENIAETTHPEYVEWLAGQGEVSVQLALGAAHRLGVGRERDPEAALRWFVAAAKAGSTAGAREAGLLEPDRTAGLRWLRVGAERGDSESMHRLGRELYETGRAEQGIAWLRRAALAKKYGDAADYLGRIYIRAGATTPEDELRLGESHEHDWGGLRGYRRNHTALAWYAVAADAGVAEAQYRVGRLYYLYAGSMGLDKQDAARHAVLRFERAAQGGHVPAQCALGLAHSEWWREREIERDPQECVKWLRRAADAGHQFAQYVLGPCYERGYGVKASRSSALAWYERAARERVGLDAPERDYLFDGNPRRWAMTSIGRLATDGTQTGWRVRRGIELLRIVLTTSNSDEAMALLSEAYRHGRGVPRSDDVADAWRKRAVELGYQPD